VERCFIRTRRPSRSHRFSPSAHVARFVDHYWLARWRLESGEDHQQSLLTHPVVNLSISEQACRVVGPSTGVVERHLAGLGWAFGVMFRPGGFWPLLRVPLSSIAHCELDLCEVLPEAAASIADAGRIAERVNETSPMDEVLARLLPGDPQPSEKTTQLAELTRSDRKIVRAARLADVAGVSVRVLERRFAQHVGLSPKKVIQRYRLQEVTEQARSGTVDWASVAADLSYADQAHLIRDFKAVTGETPATYSKAEASSSR
jgi:AraC-like DNA-binding protein